MIAPRRKRKVKVRKKRRRRRIQNQTYKAVIATKIARIAVKKDTKR